MVMVLAGNGSITGVTSMPTGIQFGSTVGVTGAMNTSSTLATASRGISAASVPSGSILQVVQTVKSDTFSSSSGSWVDVTGLTVSITPTYSTASLM